MKKSKYFVCPHCGNLTLTTGDASITCCGRSLEPVTAKKAEESEKFHVEVIENDWFLTTDHPMEKENYISFVAFAMGLAAADTQTWTRYLILVQHHKGIFLSISLKQNSWNPCTLHEFQLFSFHKNGHSILFL